MLIIFILHLKNFYLKEFIYLNNLFLMEKILIFFDNTKDKILIYIFQFSINKKEIFDDRKLMKLINEMINYMAKFYDIDFDNAIIILVIFLTLQKNILIIFK